MQQKKSQNGTEMWKEPTTLLSTFSQQPQPSMSEKSPSLHRSINNSHMQTHSSI